MVQTRNAAGRYVISVELYIADRGGAEAGRELGSGGTGGRAAWLLDWYGSSAAVEDGGGRRGGVAMSGRRPSLLAAGATLRTGASALPGKASLLPHCGPRLRHMSKSKPCALPSSSVTVTPTRFKHPQPTRSEAHTSELQS